MLATADWPANRRVRATLADQHRRHGPAAARRTSRGRRLARAGRPTAPRSPSSRAAACSSCPPTEARRGRCRSGRASSTSHGIPTARPFISSRSTADRRRTRAPATARRHRRARRNAAEASVEDGRRRRDETRVTSGPDYVFAYRIAADGKRIIISRRPTRLPADSDRMELWNIAADGTDPIQLTKNAVPEEDGELAPDGSQVLFRRAREPPAGAVLQRQCLSRAGDWWACSRADAGLPVRSAARGLGGRQQVDLDGREHRRAQSTCSRSISRRRNPGRSPGAITRWCRRRGASSRDATCS